MKLRKKACLIASIISSVILIISCIICNYLLTPVSFLCSLFLPYLFVINIVFLLYWLFKNRRNIIYPLLSLVFYFLFFTAPYQFNLSQEKVRPDAFSFMSYNVRGLGSTHFVRDIENSKRILSFVKSESPDIICFQEFSRFELNTFSYYPYRFIGYRPDYLKTLQVIYSNFPIVNQGFVDFPNTRNQTIFADIEFENEVVRIYNIHLQSYQLRVDRSNVNLKSLLMVLDKVDIAQKMQEKQVQIILDHAKTFKGKVIFSGDFNSMQYSKNYKNLKSNKIDSFDEAGLGLGATYSRLIFPFIIDYVLVDEGIDVLSHQNFDVKLSDHEPILTKLAIN